MQHSKIISGIDIGTSKVTTIIGQYFEIEDRLNVVAVSSFPSVGFVRGHISDLKKATDTITKSIEAAERMAGFELKSIVVGVEMGQLTKDDNEIDTRIESFNSKGVVAITSVNGEINQSDIKHVIESTETISIPKGKQILHSIPRLYTVDGQSGITNPVGMIGNKLELETHIIVGPSNSVKNLHSCFDNIGISVDSFVYSGVTSAQAAISSTEKELGVALIDIGGTLTSITIITDGSPVFSAVVNLGANYVTNDLAIGLRLSLEDAEKIKLRLNKVIEEKKFEDEVDLSQFGILSEEKHKISIQTAVNGIIKPRLEEIFTIIYDQIENSGFINNIPAGVVLTGGGALTVNAKEICSKIIPLPVRIATPPKLGGIVDDILNPSYTSTIGLLMYNLEHGISQSNNSKKSKPSMGGLIGKIKSMLEPLLP